MVFIHKALPHNVTHPERLICRASKAGQRLEEPQGPILVVCIVIQITVHVIREPALFLFLNPWDTQFTG